MKLCKREIRSTIANLLFLAALLSGCSSESKNNRAQAVTEEARIVSLNGAVSEIISALGMEKNIVGTDITSTYPVALQELPKVGHPPHISVEGGLSCNPTMFIGTSNKMSTTVLEQLTSSGIPTHMFEQDFSVAGTKKLIREVGAALNKPDKAEELINQLESDLLTVKPSKAAPKVLFIYARGAGTLLVAGQKTQMDQVIQLAGGVNAVQEFEDFKPLTPEFLVEANPDYILLFESGFNSLQGASGLMKLPGVAETTAGKKKQIITMDDLLLSGFGPRLGKAVKELSEALNTNSNE